MNRAERKRDKIEWQGEPASSSGKRRGEREEPRESKRSRQERPRSPDEVSPDTVSAARSASLFAFTAAAPVARDCHSRAELLGHDRQGSALLCSQAMWR